MSKAKRKEIMNLKGELKPCPACGGAAIQYPQRVECSRNDCGMAGPCNDPRGDKWYALPRRGDQPPAQSVLRSSARDERLQVATHLLASMELCQAIMINGDVEKAASMTDMVRGCLRVTDALIAAVDGKGDAK